MLHIVERTEKEKGLKDLKNIEIKAVRGVGYTLEEIKC